MSPISVLRATCAHLDDLAILFDGYRQFYRKPADLEAAKSFIEERLTNEDSVIFVAQSESGELVGFTQLYPTFSSVRVGRVWTLNDLFVAKSARGQGVSKALMEAAREFAASTGAIAVQLSTEKDNTVAQALYEAIGYKVEDDFLNYELTL